MTRNSPFENGSYQEFLSNPYKGKKPSKLKFVTLYGFNPLPDMPILGFSSSAANKDMMSKMMTNGDTIF